MNDFADNGGITTQQYLDVELMRVKRALPAKNDPETIYCEECEEIIPKARRKAMPGCRLCVQCQEELENQRR